MSRITIVVILACVSFASAETLESVEKTLVEKFKAYKSLSADVAMTVQISPGMGGEGKGTMEFLRDDGQEMVRTEIIMKMNFGGQLMESHTASFFDGTDAYTIIETMGQKQVMKMPASQAQGRSGGKAFFTDLKRENELRLLPEETIDGIKVYVIEAKPKKPTPQAPGLTKFYFDKDKGFMGKMISWDAGGKTMVSLTMANVKINPKLDASRFVFKAPKGVKITDMTKM